MKRMSFEDCEHIQNEDRRRLVFPTRGVEVVVKSLGLEEITQVQTLADGKDDPETNKEADVLLCALAIVSDDGTQPYNTAAGMDALRRLPETMRKRIVNAALGMIGLDGVVLKNS